MNVFVFDLETIPDIEGLRKLYDDPNVDKLSDTDLYELALLERRQATNGQSFLPLYLQKIVCISAVLATPERLNVWSIGDAQSDEAEILTRFYSGIEKYQPVLVSWNGTGFDCPVLNYRTLLHGISATRYWELGDNDAGYRWNNYQNRYHMRHLDVMDVLACYQGKANASLDKMATLLGFPGKMGMHGGEVYAQYLAGNLAGIRDYCETDVLNTYLVYLRFELMRGKMTQSQYHQRTKELRDWLAAAQKPHFDEFLRHWRQV